tara:strand:- start:644 stop:1429 length:786 start_codon:yes stop_codon:yes gene_type:complete
MDQIPGHETYGIRIPRRHETDPHIVGDLRERYGDLPYDILLYNFLTDHFKDMDVIIHLGWDTKTERWGSNETNPDNTLMYLFAYRVAAEQGVQRLIGASSVHADECFEHLGKMERHLLELDQKPGFQHEPLSYGLDESKLLAPDRIPPRPNTPYGFKKVVMEEDARAIANDERYNLEIIMVRFGGVTSHGLPYHGEESLFLSHDDCRRLMLCCIEADLKKPFTVVYGVSDNENPIVSWRNEDIGYVPQDSVMKTLMQREHL